MRVIAIIRMVIHCRSSRSRKSKKENNRVKCRNGAFLWCRRFFWDIAGNLFRTSAAQPFWEALARHATERHATLKQPWHNRRALKHRGGGLCLARTLQALFFQLAFTTILRLFYFRSPSRAHLPVIRGNISRIPRWNKPGKHAHPRDCSSFTAGHFHRVLKHHVAQ